MMCALVVHGRSRRLRRGRTGQGSGADQRAGERAPGCTDTGDGQRAAAEGPAVELPESQHTSVMPS